MRPKTAKLVPRIKENEYAREIKFLEDQKLVAYGGDRNNLPQIFQKNTAFLVLETEFQAEIFNARCHDTGETVSIERAKIFKEEYNKINSKKYPDVLNLYSMRLGVTTVIALANQKPQQTTINLADNLIGDYAIHAVRQLLQNTKIKSLNLASNMISHQGLSQIIDELSKNQNLKSLDLGVWEGSIRKNALGFEGSKYITQLMLSNKVIETLRLQDNDITPAGGELIGTALKNNNKIKNLKIAENDLRVQGIEKILEFGLQLESLDLSKNNIRPCQIFEVYLRKNQNLRKLNLEFNQLGPKGVEYIAQGLLGSVGKLVSLNLRGNQLGDEGVQILAQALSECENLEELDLALNDIFPTGIEYLAEILPNSNIKVLNLSKNMLGDESIIMLCNNKTLQKLDVSSSRLTDKGFLHFLEFVMDIQDFISLRANDNYISEKVEKVLIEILDKNKFIQDLQVNGNRLSLCCLNRIQKIIQRNIKLFEEKEPNKIRSEIYKLKYEQKKILMAKEKLQLQEKEIIQIEEQKHKVIGEMERIRQAEQSKRQHIQERIEEHKNMIEKKKKIIEDKQADFERNKIQKQMEIDQYRQEFQTAFQKRKECETEYEKLQSELDIQESKYKDEVTKLEDSIAEKKKKQEEVEKMTALLREELSKLSRPESQQIQIQEKQQQQEPQEQQPEKQEAPKKDTKKKEKKNTKKK